MICTLVFLAFQIRQNTNLLRTNAKQLEQSYQFAVAESLGLNSTGREQAAIAIAQDAELSRIYFSGLKDYRSMPAEDRVRFTLIMGPLIGGVSGQSERQAQLGLHDEIPPESLAFAVDILGKPGGRQWWERYANTYPVRFRHVIDRELGKEPSGDELKPTQSDA